MSTTHQLSALPNTMQERPDTERAPDARSGGAWMREMERAQLSSWFASTTVNPQAATPTCQAAHPTTQPAQTRCSVPVRLEWTAYARAPAGTANVRTASVTAGPYVAPGHMAPGKQQASVPIGHTAPAEQARARMTFLLQEQLKEALDGVQTPATLLAPQPDQTPLRLHIEPDTNGVAAWIGTELDVASLQQHLPLLMETLRRSLHSQGLRLNSLTLNGRIVWQPSASEPALFTSKEM